VQTLSRALFEEVIFDKERVTSVDWASYPILRFPDAPDIVVDLRDPAGAAAARRRRGRGGAGFRAALANAIFDATGARLRQAPLTRQRVKEALTHALTRMP